MIAKFLPVALLAAALVSTACSSNPASPSAADATTTISADAQLNGRSSLPTIAGLAVADGRFTTLVAALGKANLVGTFNGNVHYSVFAPTDAAFDATAIELGYANGMALVNALPVGRLTAILQYHVTRGDRNSTSLLAAGSVRMLDGNTATVAVANGGPAINNTPIAIADLRASNGIVHAIGGVLLPPQ